MELNFLDFCAESIEPGWLVPGFLPERALSLMIGDGGSGKTLLSLSLALSLSTGRSWLHNGPARPERAHTVWFIDEDGSPPLLRSRIKKLAAGMSIDLVALRESGRFRTCSSNGYKIDGSNFLGRLITDSKCDRPPDLLIFDALIGMISSQTDENSASQMAAIMRDGFRQVVTAVGCAVLILHHVGKPAKETSGRNALQKSRGSSEIINSTDQVLHYYGSKGYARKLSIARSRLMPEPNWPDTVKVGLESTGDVWRLLELEPLKVDKAVEAMINLHPNGHLTIDDWCARLSKSGHQFTRSTVYRALSHL